MYSFTIKCTLLNTASTIHGIITATDYNRVYITSIITITTTKAVTVTETFTDTVTETTQVYDYTEITVTTTITQNMLLM